MAIELTEWRKLHWPKPEELFWARVEKSDGCWLWLGAKNRGGYGSVTIGQRRHKAHRLAYQFTHGPLLVTEWILHSCDNPGCVNPAHLRIGDHRANMRDAKERGRVRNANTDRTHCRHGHAFTPENTYDWRGHRICRQCNADRMVQFRKRRPKRTISSDVACIHGHPPRPRKQPCVECGRTRAREYQRRKRATNT